MSIPIASVRRGGHVVLVAWTVFAVGCSDTDNNPPGGSAGTGGAAGSSGHAGQGSAGHPDGGSAGGVSTAGAGGALCREASSLGEYTPCASAGSGGVSAGSGGVSAGSGGVAGAGDGPGILNVSPSFLTMDGQCTAPPATFTISNTGGSALTWNAILHTGQSLVDVEPSSSTLLPGAQVTVSVNVKLPFAGSSESIFMSINSDVAPQPPSVTVVYQVTGIVIDKQPDIDVGEGHLGQYKLVQVPTPSKSASFSLGSPDPAFIAPTELSHGSDHWDLDFHPSVLGPQSTTLQIGAPFVGGVCPVSNRFITVRGVGIP